MNEELRSILIGTLGLDLAAAVALYLTLSRGKAHTQQVRAARAVRVVALAILLQAAHFIEELATGFHIRFPELLGLSAWPLSFFIPFNLGWLAIWVLAAIGLPSGTHAALFPIWFLGLGCIVNAVAHPAFALASQTYFPGLLTSPFLGVVGVLVLRSLARATVEPRSMTGAAYPNAAADSQQRGPATW